ncbi:RNA methyltransferase, TrmH family, group 3 [Alkaliphilus metalliredigens QYMF]|uniref:RNA methyltransferase, TrmH family, group 3 n=1 Tax=Alkaliphilus metalliredigens (strain QYMF) TaxID=293826 RepID=A6TNP7_ALKMQ|nr:RNA methyltransferase [Alkaliphilus metalliredigens]ABR47815.1 RNA methyltransferase, TrmH family, group 3 [Alkaliphilus metalliredigens QYMF]
MMEQQIITSDKNAVLKHIKGLSLRKNRIKHQQFTIEGLRIVEECFLHGGPIDHILYCDHIHQVQGGPHLLEKLKEKYPCHQTMDSLFLKIADTETPQGIIAVVEMKNHQLESLDLEKKENPFIVVLDEIQDPGNLGTIIRTAEGAKTDAIILTKGCVDPYNSKSIRATMGAIFHLPIIQSNNNEEWIYYLKANAVKLVASTLETDKNHFQLDYNNPIAMIIGNEARGIHPDILAQVDERVKIPILGKIESLNASVAAGILIYQGIQGRFLKD